jgi:Tol biopolymer transport system component
LNDQPIAFATAELICLLTPDGRLAARFPSQFRENEVAFQFTGLSWQAGHQGLVYCGHQARRWMHLFTTNLDGSQQQRLFPAAGSGSDQAVHSPACASDGQRIAFVVGIGAQAQEIVLLDPSSGEPERLHSVSPEQALGSPTWLAAPSRLALLATLYRHSAEGPATYQSSGLEMRDLRGGAPQRLLSSADREVLEQIRAAPDGRRIALLRRRELELLGGRTYSEWTAGMANPRQADYMRKIARQLHPFPLEQRSLNVYDLGLREERQIFSGEVEAFDWSPQGDQLAFTDGSQIWLARENAPPASIYRSESGEIRALAWAN